MFDLGAGELVLIVFVVLILFGPKKLPELAQSLGRGMREFKRAQREFTEQINQAVNDDHYKKKSVAERETPAGAVSRGGSRRIAGSPDDSGARSDDNAGRSDDNAARSDDTRAATPTGYPIAGTPPSAAAPRPDDASPSGTTPGGEPNL
ncbi:MAG TPA: twin-arginine translocase TatA/TatE family subunit [Candidatus Kapabacteria bacterium]|nr:twin-arginine translocase TatA/TatE family subunit [Candidatus Kapabacteria bacterium]